MCTSYYITWSTINLARVGPQSLKAVATTTTPAATTITTTKIFRPLFHDDGKKEDEDTCVHYINEYLGLPNNLPLVSTWIQ